MSNPNTSGLPPYNEQKTKKMVTKSIAIYTPPMGVIKQMKAKDTANLNNLKNGKRKK
jgi:hypothetical protein